MPESDDIVLASESLRVSLSRQHGGITSMQSLLTGWQIAGEAGEAFALGIPVPGRAANQALASRQPAPTWEVGQDRAVATWSQVWSEFGGRHEISVVMGLQVRGPAIIVEVSIGNATPDLWVEEVRSPVLAGVRPAADALTMFQPFYGTAVRRSMFPSFENMPGYWGVRRPTILTDGPGHLTSPGLPHILLEAPEEGVYLGLGGRSDSPMGWLAELHPGWLDSMTKHVPPPGFPGPERTCVRVSAGHLPYVGPGETRTLTPVAMAAYIGDWHAGVDRYRQLSTEWRLPAASVPAWASEPAAWQQVQLNANDSLTHHFDDLPRIAAHCSERGVGTIQVVGWNTLGQDNGNPDHTPDPRLGGAEGLARAIAQCQALGVRVVLFTKFTWADKASEEYRDGLRRLAVRDPYGDEYPYFGYAYQTLSQLWDVSTHRLVPMCFGAQEYLDRCVKEFGKVIAAGADGMLYDECQHHMPTIVCFADDHGHRRGFPVYTNDNELIRRFRKVPGIPTEFLMAGEAVYDDELEVYQVSYFRTDDQGHLPVARYTRPESMLVTAVVGFDDRTMVNQCLLYRYVISYEPYFFKGTLVDIPATVSYGMRMDDLRTSLREWFWDGEFRDTVGLRVTDEQGQSHPQAALFISEQDGSPGVVISNESPDTPATLTIQIEGGPERIAWRLVEDEHWSDAPTIHIPARSAIVALAWHRSPLASG